MLKKYAIIVAGGSGTRMQSSIPKQFHLLADKPVLFHTLEKFHLADSRIEILLVLPKNHITSWEELCKRYEFTVAHKIIEGGETRFHSVKNGLNAITEEGIVAVHDGVRPLITPDLINTLFAEAELKGNAVPVVAVPDSMRTVSGERNFFTDRSMYRLVQTPQCFKVNILKKAFEQEYRIAFTDEANVAESIGTEIHLVQGENRNFKITTSDDLVLAEAMLKNSL